MKFEKKMQQDLESGKKGGVSKIKKKTESCNEEKLLRRERAIVLNIVGKKSSKIKIEWL